MWDWFYLLALHIYLLTWMKTKACFANSRPVCVVTALLDYFVQCM